MLSFLQLLLGISVICWFVFAILWFKNRKIIDKRKKYRNYFFISFIAYIALLLVVSPQISENQQSSKEYENSKQLESYKAKDSSEKIKKQSKKSNETESSKSDNTSKEETDKMIEKADKEQLAKYKKALKKVPEKTNYAITSAYVKNKNASVAVLNDSVLGASSNELKSIAKSAFNGMQNIMSQYLSYDGDYAPRYLYIIDSSDNIIAKSSITGKFKYEGE